jgi:hypothetical protein
VQAESWARDRFCRNDENLIFRAPLLRNAHKNVAVVAIPTAVAMKVKVPALVVVCVPATVHGDGVRVPSRKGNTQCDSDVTIHEKIELAVARDLLNVKSHAAQLRGDGCFFYLMLVLSVHAVQPADGEP